MTNSSARSAAVKIKFILLLLILHQNFANGQEYNHQWLLGNQWLFTDPKARMYFDASSYVLQPEFRKMVFEGTEGNICDANGNFLMSSNGVWIANANNDTMMNGNGLNPGTNVNSYPHALLDIYANIFLPYPGDSTKYVLFHHTDEWDGISYPAYEVFYSVIDKTLDGGLGGVDSTQKNVIAFQDTLNWGLAACRHANGRDWWIVAQKHNTDIIFKILFTPNGIASITSQQLNVPVAWYNVTQPTFSPDGTKFGYTTYDTLFNRWVLIFDFDRCTGIFSNQQVIDITDGHLGVGLAFSPNSKFIYAASFVHLFQINIDNLTVDTVAVVDTFYSGGFLMNFFLMYLAANGKIYITSGSSAQHIHEMNYPDSTDIACNFQQHAVNLGIWVLRSVPNHPNYYLGCDTTCTPCLATGLNNLSERDFYFRIYPNPILNNTLNIGYFLPQNKNGLFQIYDITGKVIFKYTLPQWSNEQNFKLPELSDGIYNCVITSGGVRISKKIVILPQ
jgi:hypothetical protein